MKVQIPVEERNSVQQFETHPIIRVSAGLMAIAGGAIAIVIGVFSLIAKLEGQPPFLWAPVIFAIPASMAMVFAVLFMLGRFKEAPGILLLSVGGTLLVSASLAERNIGGRFAGRNVPPTPIQDAFLVGDITILYPMVLQALLGIGLIGLAGLVVLLRHPKVSFTRLVLSMVCGLPVLALAAAFVTPITRLRPRSYFETKYADDPAQLHAMLNSSVLSYMMSPLNTFMLAVLSILGLFATIALVSASGHFLIRSLEAGKAEDAKP
ncbi:MAG: hypothetical protein AAGB34_03405 [Planctomycetota bacterium]